MVYFAHGLAEQIPKQCAFFTIFTVAFYFNKHVV